MPINDTQQSPTSIAAKPLLGLIESMLATSVPKTPRISSVNTGGWQMPYNMPNGVETRAATPLATHSAPSTHDVPGCNTCVPVTTTCVAHVKRHVCPFGHATPPVWGVSTCPQDQMKRGAAHPRVPPHPGRHFKEGRETPHQLLPGDASPRPQHASRASGHV